MRSLAVTVIALGAAPLLGLGWAEAEGKPQAEKLFTFTDPAVNESSGLVEIGAYTLTVNDSEGDPVIYVVETATGNTVGRTTYAAANVDVEALARGQGKSIWVGDIGDNRGERDTISVYKVGTVTPGDRVVDSVRYELAYPDGARDSETLLIHPQSGRLYIVTKGLFSGQVLRAPKVLNPQQVNPLTPVTSTRGLVTDGSFTRDGKRIVLRDYSNAEVLRRQGFKRLGTFSLPEQDQAEGLAMRPGSKAVALSSEGENQAVYSVRIPRRYLSGEPKAAAGATPAATGTADAEPDNGPPPGEQSTSSPDNLGAQIYQALPLALVVLACLLLLRAGLRLRADSPRSR